MEQFGIVLVVQGELDSHGSWVKPVSARQQELHDLDTARTIVVTTCREEGDRAAFGDEIRCVWELEAECIDESIFGCLDVRFHLAIYYHSEIVYFFCCFAYGAGGGCGATPGPPGGLKVPLSSRSSSCLASLSAS